MSIYYEDEAVTLYHGNCLTETAWLEADVLVTDPPYGRAWKSGSGMTNSHGRGRGSIANGGIANDESTEVRDAALRAWLSSGPEARPGVVFGDPLIPQPEGACQALVYAKAADAGIKGARAGFRRDVEMVYLIGPWPVAVGGDTSVLRSSRWVAGPTAPSAIHGHPHAKPTDLMERLVTLAGSVNIVADPFAGSGSTLVAAKNAGMNAVGVELEERCCEVIAKRLSQGVLDFGDAS